MPYTNKEDARRCSREWYARNKQNEVERARKRKQQLLEWIQTFKTALKCLRCPENHPACLDFHHRNPNEKDISISNAVANGWSKLRILKEIDKCDVLCANCHRKHHFNALSFNGQDSRL